MSDPVRDRLRFPGSRPGNDQERALRVQRGIALPLVEAVEVVHRTTIALATDLPLRNPKSMAQLSHEI